jgi:hypothetical protein
MDGGVNAPALDLNQELKRRNLNRLLKRCCFLSGIARRIPLTSKEPGNTMRRARISKSGLKLSVNMPRLKERLELLDCIRMMMMMPDFKKASVEEVLTYMVLDQGFGLEVAPIPVSKKAVTYLTQPALARSILKKSGEISAILSPNLRYGLCGGGRNKQATSSLSY